MRLQPLPGVRSGWSLEPFSNGRPRKMIVASIRGRMAHAVRDTTGSTEPGLRQSFRPSFNHEHRVVPADLGSALGATLFLCTLYRYPRRSGAGKCDSNGVTDRYIGDPRRKCRTTAPQNATAAINAKSIVQRRDRPLQRRFTPKVSCNGAIDRYSGDPRRKCRTTAP